MYFSGIHSIQLQPHAILNQLKSALFSESTSTALTEHPDGACLLACVNGCCFILILLFKHVKSWYSMCFTTGSNFLFTHGYIFFHILFFLHCFLLFTKGRIHCTIWHEYDITQHRDLLTFLSFLLNCTSFFFVLFLLLCVPGCPPLETFISQCICVNYSL